MRRRSGGPKGNVMEPVRRRDLVIWLKTSFLGEIKFPSSIYSFIYSTDISWLGHVPYALIALKVSLLLTQ